MSFQLNKNISGRIIKKNVPIGITSNIIQASTPFLASNNSILVNNRNFEPSIPLVTSSVVSAQGVTIQNTGVLNNEILSKTENIVIGSAAAGKVLTLDSAKNISGVNVLKCNNIKANGVDILTEIADPTSIVASNDYFSDNISGVATAGKCLVSNSSNDLSVKKINGVVNDTLSVFDPLSKNININLQKLGNLSNKKWIDVVYSIDLQKFVAIGNEVVATSSTGDSWNEYQKTGFLFKRLIWVSHIGKFFACTSTKVLESTDGVDWTTIMENTDILDVAVGLNKIVAVKNGTIFSKGFDSTVWDETVMTTAMTAMSWNGIIFGSSNIYGDKFILFGQNNISACLESGLLLNTNWTTTTLTGSWVSASFGNDVFIAVNGSTIASNKITTSSNGLNWFYGGVSFRSMETGMDVVGFKSIKFLQFVKLFIIIPIYSTNYFLYTSAGDEIYYSKYSSNGLLAGLDYSPLSKKIVGITSGKSLDYDNGLTYSLRPRQIPLKYTANEAGDYTNFNGLYTFNNSTLPNMVFACNAKGLMYSSDGINFNKCFVSRNGGNGFDQVDIPTHGMTYAVNLSKFIVISSPNSDLGILNGLISSDGVNWEFINIGNGNSMNWIEYSPNTGKTHSLTYSLLFTSENCITWSSQSFSGGVKISIIRNTTILHGNHLSKRYHILNADLTYTPLNGTPGDLSQMFEFTNSNITSWYAYNDKIVYKSTDNGSSWSIENNIGSVINNIVIHKELNCLAVYTSDNKVSVLQSSGTWTTNVLLDYNSRGLNSICYSDVYKCIYMSSNWPYFSINRTSPLLSEYLSSNNIFGEKKIYQTLPDFSTHERDITDNITTSLKFNTTLRSLTASPEGFRDIIFSRKTNKMYVILQYTSSFTLNTLETSNNFVDSTSTVKYSNLLDTNLGLWAVIGSSVSASTVSTSSANIQLYNKFTNSTSTIATTWTTGISHLAGVVPRFKFCKEIKAVYQITSNTIILYYPEYSTSTSINLTSEVFTFTITGSPTLLGGALCKELNMALCFSNTGGGKIISLDMRDTTKAKNIINVASKTFIQIEYHYNAKMFIILATDGVYYSLDGSTIQLSPTSGLAGNTYIWSSIKYIPELNVMGLVSTNMFAFTMNGIDWVVVPTSTQKPWISFDYNRSSGNIVLLSSTGEVLVSSPVSVTADGLAYVSNGFMNKDSLTLGRAYSTIGSNINNNFSVNISQGIIARCKNKNFSFENGYGTLDIKTQSILNINKTNNSYNESEILKINGKYLSINNNLLNNIKNIFGPADISSNNFKLIEKGGSLNLNSVNTGNLNITNNALNGSQYEDMGLVVSDSNKNVNINKLGVNKLIIGSSEISNSYTNHPLNEYQPPQNSPFLSLEKYMSFKNTNYLNGSVTVIGSAYSSELNVIVIVAGANSSTITNYISTSNDKGKTWYNLGISNGYPITVEKEVHTCKIKWISSLSCFLLAQDNNIMVSYDGYNWCNNPVSYGSNPSIMIDSKLNRITILTTSRIAYIENNSNILGDWVVPNVNKNIKMAEYYQPLNLYFFRDESNTNIIKYTSDIYTDIITSTNMETISVITDIISWNGMTYYSSDANIYRRNSTTPLTGDLVFNHPSIRFRRLTVVDTMNILVAFSDYSFAYTSNGTSWTHLQYSNAYTPSHIVKDIEGAMNDMFWCKDRLMMLVSSNGTLLESRLEESIPKYPVQYMNDLISNRLTKDKLLASSKNLDTIIRHSLTPINVYATAYGNGFFVSTGDNINIISTSLKKNQSSVSHNGQWRDIVYHKRTNQFIKIGTNLMSYITGTNTTSSSWNDITPPVGAWDSIISIDNKVIIFQSGTSSIAKIAYIDTDSELSGSTVWSDINLSQVSAKWNSIEIINGLVILSGLNYISYKPLEQIGNDAVSWVDNYFLGNWNDVSYGKNLYVFAGDGLIGRSRDLYSFRSTKTPKNYHRVIYVRLMSEFYLINKEVNYFSNGIVKDQTNSVIKSSDGINYINSMNSFLHAATVTTARPYYLSNIYYFEETDQFAMPLNNSQNKYYMFTNTYAPLASNYKITTPETFTTNATGTTMEIARGSSVIAAPATFNVFQDSAAKPATSTWITTSDRRLKEDIQTADLEQCFNNVKNLDLNYFKWKDEYITENITSDRRKLGWLAQDVETVMPKSVKKKNMFNMEDCRVLDSDQIIANMFGAVKMLIKKIKEKEQVLSDSLLE